MSYSSQEAAFLQSVGGKRLMLGGEEVWQFGLASPGFKDKIVKAEGLPEFELDGPWPGERERSNNGAAIYAAMQQHGVKEVHVKQLTGSCVGASLGNLWWRLSMIDRYVKGDPESPDVPFWLLPYGRSRHKCGMRGRGEGSLVEAIAYCISEEGVVRADEEGLPSYHDDAEGLTWGSQTELEWSDGGRRGLDKWLQMAKPYVVKAAKITTRDQALAALDNGYLIHHGSQWGGQMRPKVQGDPPVLLNRRSGTWSHAMHTDDYWFHPQFKLLYHVVNNWGKDTHGKDPAHPLSGGVGWVPASEWESQILSDDTWAYSDQQGFPLRRFDVDWLI